MPLMFFMLKKKKYILLKFQNITQIVGLSALLRGITSTHYGDFYCLNFLNSFRTKNQLDSHKDICENEDFCNINPF